MNILDDMGVSKLSGNSILEMNYSFNGEDIHGLFLQATSLHE